MAEESDQNQESLYDAAFRIDAALGAFPGQGKMEKLRFYEVALLERQTRAAQSVAANLEAIANALGSR